MQGLAPLADEVVAEAARAALRAGRPMLAGRVVGLMERVDDPDPELARALRAGHLLLRSGSPSPALQAELEDALSSLQGAWMRRFRARQRQALREGQAPPRRRPRGI